MPRASRRLAFALIAACALPAGIACSEGNPADEAVVIITEPAAEGAAEAAPAPDAAATPAAP